MSRENRGDGEIAPLRVCGVCNVEEAAVTCCGTVLSHEALFQPG